MNRPLIAISFALGLISAALMSALLLLAPSVSHAQTEEAVLPICPESWTSIQAREVLTGSNMLNGVTVISPNDVWAVGSHQGRRFPAHRPLTMHWDGTRWSIVPVPDVGDYAVLNDVSAVASNDVWAVGYGNVGNNALILHWNGTAWSEVSSPPFTGPDRLQSVVAISSNDAWAVGDTYSNGAFAIHWNGIQWSQVTIPAISYLVAIDAVSSTDVW